MGAALHLAHAHQPLEKKRKPKRKDGGDGPKFAEYAQRIYQDERADASARFLLLTIAYVLTMVPLDDDTTVWKATGKALGTRPHHWRRTSLRELVRDDVPRYEPPGYRHGTDPLDRVCRGPRMRPHPDGPEDFRNAMKVCGAPAQNKVVEKDPATGWLTNHWFCSRHHDQLLRVREQVQAQNDAAPDPVPNRGGLLPCYFDTDWVSLYRWAYDWDAWEPPSYGYRADDWPVPGQDPPPQRARLRLVVNGLVAREDDGDNT
ncbi:hypothetical protein [Streptomyces showdoensis]|uniref:Uncharacterized protein n=1 Tax=Streptomyces showdoensis TaxID=68268 RepID=A0A2P2GKT2_STREW|nr:hypothetical protein [Streptomyces showdoensis]KKZ72122.1 hypothetical protein VO63_20330 [Streptomyces showdoensis]